MSREIRRVPPDWEHPKWKPEEVQYEWQRDGYHPLLDESFAAAMDEWYAKWKKWQAGERPEDADANSNFFDYESRPPNPDYYRQRHWTEAEATHFQMYETVTEGTPVTPAFATKAELVDHLVKHGEFRDPRPWERAVAERFVEREWASSGLLIVTEHGVTAMGPRDGS